MISRCVVLVVALAAGCVTSTRVVLHPTIENVDRAIDTLELGLRRWPDNLVEMEARHRIVDSIARMRRDLAALVIVARHVDRQRARRADLDEADALALRLARELTRLSAGVPLTDQTVSFHAAIGDAITSVVELTRELTEQRRRRWWLLDWPR